MLSNPVRGVWRGRVRSRWFPSFPSFPKGVSSANRERTIAGLVQDG